MPTPGGFTLTVRGTSAARLRHQRATHRPARGATLVEYALGVSLVLVASMVAIGAVEDASGERLRDDATRVGHPDLNALSPGPPGSGSGSGSGGDTSSPETTSPPPAGTIDPALTLSANASRHGNSWSVTITVTATDPANGGATVPGVVVVGAWTPAAGGRTTCTTNADGKCTMTQSNMESRSGRAGYVAEVSFAVQSVTGENISYTQSPPPSIGPVAVP